MAKPSEAVQPPKFTAEHLLEQMIVRLTDLENQVIRASDASAKAEDILDQAEKSACPDHQDEQNMMSLADSCEILDKANAEAFDLAMTSVSALDHVFEAIDDLKKDIQDLQRRS